MAWPSPAGAARHRARIGIDGHVLGKNIGGVERYVAKLVELVPGLMPQHDFVVFVTRHAAERYGGDPRPNVRFVSLPVSDPIIQRSVLLPWAARRHRLDVLHLQRIAPWGCGCRVMLTIHDLIPLKHPGAYPGFRDKLIRLLTPGSIARADFIVCPSQFVCDEIAHRYPRTSVPLHPYYNGVDAAAFRTAMAMPITDIRRKFGLDGPFLFVPGAIEVRKNVELVVAALARIDPAARPLLVLSGSIRDGACYARLQALAGELGVADRIRHLGFVSDDELAQLYAGCSLCIAASVDEGFDMPPLEAMACGAPVLCSDIPVHRELFEGAARFFAADDPAALAGLIGLRPTGDPGPMDGVAAACVDRFSWEAMAGRMAGFYAAACGFPAHPDDRKSQD